MAWPRVGSGLQAQVVNASDKATPGNVAQETTVLNTSQSHTMLRGRASCSLWYAPVANVCDLLLLLDEKGDPRIQAFLKGHFPG